MLRSSPLTARFSDAQRVQGMLDFEAALVRAQASCGTVPQDAVAPIVSACQHSAIDFPALGLAAASAGNPAIPLVKQLTARVKTQDAGAARYVHWGRPARCHRQRAGLAAARRAGRNGTSVATAD